MGCFDLYGIVNYGFQKIRAGPGEMAGKVKHLLLQKARVQFSAVPRGPTLSSEPCRHQAHTGCTHTGRKTLIHIQINKSF